jgi:acyl carrier protein
MTGPVLTGLEAPIRRVVADRLGVAPEELTPDVSLTDDLAADSLDLLEVSLTLEADFGLSIPEQALSRVRTYGDLVDTVLTLVRARRQQHAGEPVLVAARVVPTRGGAIERAGWLTPYVAQSIGEDARRAGEGTRLELGVRSDTSDAHLARIVEQFAWLAAFGVAVKVSRKPGVEAA